MCANASPTASLSPSTSTGRSLLSRLTLPLKTRTRNLTDFHIEPEEPHRKYAPGDLVKGAVVLTIVKPIRITHLTVCLHGFVRVFKHPNGAKEPLPELTATGNSTKSQYFGNGHASLFQDEVPLCGEGRLDTGVYEFKFELEFPRKGCPSSIDFERGTISYMITSTLTRPTSIAPTSSCEQKISLVETVDVGPLLAPGPREISLEPISRKTRRRRTTRRKEGGPQDNPDTGSRSDAQTVTSPLPDESASQCGSTDHQTNNTTSQSPAPSEIRSNASVVTSSDSTVSSITGLSFRLAPAPSSARSAQDSKGSKVSTEEKTITATIELLKSGCLPGDNLPLKISIKHAKPIKSMHGIIITFYRQGRIDSAPPLYLFTSLKGKEAERLKHDEYYPKSKTGLGGLSLSSAGSSNMFRKDLAQTFAPILVDPVTLSTVVNVSVRVPEDAFPTISGVPGQMISFKYHIEVVVDLGGKLAGQQRHVPRVGAITVPTNYGNSSGSRSDGNSNVLAAWGGSLVDTDHIRREKSVVACVFEVVVGTKDSARDRRRGNNVNRQGDRTGETPITSPTSREPLYEESAVPGDGYQQPYPYYDQAYDSSYPDYYPNESYEYQEFPLNHYPPPSHADVPVPPPEMHPDEGFSEKERARLAEERLLPSQPTVDAPGLASAMTAAGPSAPPADLYSADDLTPQATLRNGSSVHTTIGPSAPALEDLHPAAALQPTEDKQELERRRLLAEASAPSEFRADEDDNVGEGSSSRTHEEPSAPVLWEEYEYGGQYSHHNFPGPSSEGDTLPKYER